MDRKCKINAKKLAIHEILLPCEGTERGRSPCERKRDSLLQTRGLWGKASQQQTGIRADEPCSDVSGLNFDALRRSKMKIYRIVAVILCAAMLIAVLYGCNNPQQDDQPTDEAPSAQPSPVESSNTPEINQNLGRHTAFTAFAPDTVMIITDDSPVTWAELYFHLHNNVMNLLASVGEIMDWTTPIDNDDSYADLVMTASIQNAMIYRAVEYGARINGVALTDADYEILTNQYESVLAEYDNEDAYLQMLWDENGVYSISLYEHLVNISYLANKVFESMYGVEGSKLSDAEAEVNTASDGYLMAKHILRLKPEEGVALSVDPLKAIEDVMKQLDNYAGDDLGAFFDELMYEHSEDEGLSMFPNGYLFQYGDMVPEFYEACISLDYDEYSEIIETTYGYHIVLRLPIDYDSIPSSRAREYDYRTLRYITAAGLFDKTLFDWLGILKTEHTADFERVDVAKLFSSYSIE